MKITIIGLGIIGGSYAKGLSMKGYEVYGVDKDENTIKYAICKDVEVVNILNDKFARR